MKNAICILFLSLPVLSVVLMMGLAILLNLCSDADAFIAASFRGSMPVFAQTAFLLTGPMFDLKRLKRDSSEPVSAQ